MMLYNDGSSEDDNSGYDDGYGSDSDDGSGYMMVTRMVVMVTIVDLGSLG